MDRTERFHLIDQMINTHKSVTRSHFLSVLEVSLATFKRDIEYMRDRLGAPIVWQRDINAYVYEKGQGEQNFQLPGLWFNTSEIHALLTMDALLENLQQGMLSQHIKPLQARIKSLLDQGDFDVREIGKRIRVLTVAAKTYKSEYFQVLNQALLKRKQLHIKHFNRSSNQYTQRQISPQRLTFYKDNWYLDAWCHGKEALRRFSVDAIETIDLDEQLALEVDAQLIDQELGNGYGIFSGTATQKAVLKFNEKRARWVSKEKWHPDQQSKFDEQGFYWLTVPYSQPTELLMDILKYGEDVEVMEPSSLRKKMQQIVQQMSQLYAG